jgi:alpha-tubulin suppressor-like RCC1 family protein
VKPGAAQRPRLTPSGNRQYLRIDAGDSYTCAIASADRHAYCWGINHNGQLGTGTTSSSLTPVAVTGGRSWLLVAAGFQHTCGITTAGAVFCWGRDDGGSLGDNSSKGDRSVPTPIASARQFNELDVGTHHSCAITSDHRGFCWGQNGVGQIGDGTKLDRYTPRAVAGGNSFNRVAAGASFTCGETVTHQAYCWGDNEFGQFGNGKTQSSTRPVLAAGGREFNQVTTGGFHACGITSSGAAYCWGYNSSGQLGDGNGGVDVQSTTPVPVSAP